MSSKIFLYLFRHGETDWNRERRFQGHTDIPLNAEGCEQAKALTPILSRLSLDLILTSDLLRAQQTAAIVNQELKLPLVVAKDLRECRLGEPEGMLRDNIVAVYGAAQWERWLSIDPQDQDFGFPGGETKNDHLNRLKNFLENYFETHPELQKVGISTHGGSIRRLVHHCKNAPKTAVSLPNCALYLISHDRQTREWTYDAELSTLGDSNVWGK